MSLMVTGYSILKHSRVEEEALFPHPPNEALLCSNPLGEPAWYFRWTQPGGFVSYEEVWVRAITAADQLVLDAMKAAATLGGGEAVLTVDFPSISTSSGALSIRGWTDFYANP